MRVFGAVFQQPVSGMSSILIIGAGGHSRSVISVVRAENKWDPVGVIDIDDSRQNESILGVPVLMRLDSLLMRDLDVKRIVVAIGNNNLRASISSKFEISGFQPTTVISPESIIDPTASIGNGTVVMPGAVVCALAEVGNGCIVNTSSILEHESSIGDWGHIAPGAVVAGRSHMGDYVFIGANSTVIDNCSVGNGVTIGAGSVLVSDALGEDSKYVGVPARKISKKKNSI